MTQKKNKQIYIILTTAIILLVVIAFVVIKLYNSWIAANTLPEIMSAPTVALEATTGETYNSDNGKVKLITFFFTNCPDICPMTLVDFQDIQQTLKEDGLFGEKVELLAITLDPERDDIKTLQQYSKGFNPDPNGWHFLRGSDEEIKDLTKQLKYTYHKDESGFVNHPTSMYIIDQNNVVRSLHRMTTPTESLNQELIISNIKKLIKEPYQGNEQENIPLYGSPLDVKFGSTADSTLTLDQSIEFSIQVTQDGTEVEDADEVSFEIWYAGEHEHETIPAQHQGQGVYSIDKTLEQAGNLNVMYHVTARGYHSMKKHELVVER